MLNTDHECLVIFQELVTLITGQHWDVREVAIFPILLNLFGGQLKPLTLFLRLQPLCETAKGGVVQREITEGVWHCGRHSSHYMLLVLVLLKGGGEKHNTPILTVG
jgi:hypothetical protein